MLTLTLILLRVPMVVPSSYSKIGEWQLQWAKVESKSRLISLIRLVKEIKTSMFYDITFKKPNLNFI